MTGQLLDFLFLASSTGAVLAIAAAGIFVLPWQDDELDDTVRALHAAGRLFERLAHHAGNGVRRLESMDRGTHVFEPPTAPAA